MPAAEQLIGGYWGVNPSPVIDDYVAAAWTLSGPFSGALAGTPPVAWTIRKDQRVSPSPDGRPIAGYPIPVDDAVWVALTLNGGNLLANPIDYTLSDGYIWFEIDPFYVEQAYLVWTGSEFVEALDLWYSRPPATIPGTSPLDATWNSLVRTISAGCDSPATGRSEEFVESVWQAADGSWRIVTDAAAYRLVADDTPSVSAGQTLALGTALGSAWELTHLGPKTLAESSSTYITTPASFHQGVTTGPITWYRATTPLVVDTVSSRTRVRFDIGGSSGDVTAVWGASMTNGIANGRTLAQALDTRSNPVGDPGPESLPTVISPMDFLCRELLAGCAYRLIVHPAKFGPAAGTVATLTEKVREAVGAYAAVFVWTDTEPAEAIP